MANIHYYPFSIYGGNTSAVHILLFPAPLCMCTGILGHSSLRGQKRSSTSEDHLSFVAYIRLVIASLNFLTSLKCPGLLYCPDES